MIDDVDPVELEGDLRLEAGRIRPGDSDPGRTQGARIPKRLSTWRLTSPDQQLMARAAAAYGGRVKRWDRRPTKEPMQWELITTTNRLSVVVPPRSQVVAWWELWDGAICVRRCNLVTDRKSGDPCLCKAELERRRVDLAELSRRPGELAKALKCDRYARLQVYLPDLPGLKPWLLTTQSWYSAASLQTAIANELTWVPPLTPVDMVLGTWTVRAREGSPPKTVNRVFPVITFDVAPHQTLGELLRQSAAARLASLAGAGPPPALSPPPPPAPSLSGRPVAAQPEQRGDPQGWSSGGHIPPEQVVPPHDPGVADAGGQPSAPPSTTRPSERSSP